MNDVRNPAVAGLFYENRPQVLREAIEALLLERDAEALARAAPGVPPCAPAPVPAENVTALLLPHAGHMYSGRIAAAGVGAVLWPRRVILLGPNHRGAGAPLAISPASAWRTPLGDLPVSSRLSAALLAEGPFEKDGKAHAREHALEVIAPFLQVVRPDVEAAFVSVGRADLALCEAAGRAVAEVVKSFALHGEKIALVVSSDLNHYLDRAANWRKDLRALELLLEGDPEVFFRGVLYEDDISMCGVLPATVLLYALRSLPSATGRVLLHGDASATSGDAERVVGYAAVLWESRRESSSGSPDRREALPG
ncbi:MAG: AmmeMemoRadiSam system protein B [Acidobacteria bacterium]|nr:AmmeMemoRadiSam system protein B [Acidobacteriota bacterium]